MCDCTRGGRASARLIRRVVSGEIDIHILFGSNTAFTTRVGYHDERIGEMLGKTVKRT